MAAFRKRSLSFQANAKRPHRVSQQRHRVALLYGLEAGCTLPVPRPVARGPDVVWASSSSMRLSAPSAVQDATRPGI